MADHTHADMPIGPNDFRDARILAGPTGSGKSSLALDLADAMNAEIIAMDSMTLYRGLDIGTAKPSAADRARVPHHLIDVLDPWESANVAWWLEKAATHVKEIVSRGKSALIVGGTPMYLKALMFGLFDGPPADPVLRHQLESQGAPRLHARLAVVDPACACKVHPNDLRRLVRALEVYELTGRPMSEWQSQWSPKGGSPSDTAARVAANVVCLDVPRSELYSRIDRRVLHMIEAGWLDETRRLRELAQPVSREAGLALGYRELGDVLDGKTSLADATALIQQKSRQYAKRQLTWFRNLPGLRFLGPELTSAAWESRIT